MNVMKWGERLVVDLPADVIDRLGLKEGDEVAIEVADDHTLRLNRDDERARAIASLRSRATPLPPGYKFDREEANER